MIASQLIDPHWPFLQTSDNVSKALNYMEELKTEWLPVVESGVFAGFLSESILLEQDDSVKISKLPPLKVQAKVKEDEHFLEVIKSLVSNDLPCVAVVGTDGVCKGVVTQAKIFDFLAHFGFISAPGGILVLSVPLINYSLHEISRIAESNDTKILAVFVTESPNDAMDVWVTLKCNRTDLARTIAAYQRFGYEIEAAFHESNFGNIEQERLDMLFRYLNI
jgi:acetoin utilization protein AcuB